MKLKKTKSFLHVLKGLRGYISVPDALHRQARGDKSSAWQLRHAWRQNRNDTTARIRGLSMRIVHINITDGMSGAGVAARRLHLEYRRQGHDLRMLVWRKYTDDPYVDFFEKRPFPRALSQVVGRKLDSMGLQYLFHPASMHIAQHPWLREVDIIHLHVIHGSYFSLRALPALSRRAPIVWTMHDMWAASGHCATAAYAACQRWQIGCGDCPSLDNYPAVRWDTTRSLWRAKAHYYGQCQLVVVCPSVWLSEQMQRSPLLNRFPIETIANGVDLGTFRPVAREVAREALGLPQDKKIIMFGAPSLADPGKGARVLVAALGILAPRWGADAVVLLVGRNDGDVGVQMAPFGIVSMGSVQNEALMALCYAAADLFVSPSLAENLPNTLIESLACGTPAVAFDVGGSAEIVTHGVTGYIARPGDAADLASGIEFLLDENELRQEMRKNGRIKAQQSFEISVQASHYIGLYERYAARSPS